MKGMQESCLSNSETVLTQVADRVRIDDCLQGLLTASHSEVLEDTLSRALLNLH